MPETQPAIIPPEMLARYKELPKVARDMEAPDEEARQLLRRVEEAAQETELSKETAFLDALAELNAHWGQPIDPEKYGRLRDGKDKIAEKIRLLLRETGARLDAIADREAVYAAVFDYMKRKERDAAMEAFTEAGLHDDDSEARQALLDKLRAVAEDFSYPMEEIFEEMKLGPEHGGRIILD